MIETITLLVLFALLTRFTYRLVQRREVFTPTIIFPVLYILHFYIGSRNVFRFPLAISSFRAHVGDQVLVIALIGIFSFMAGSHLATFIKINTPRPSRLKLKKYQLRARARTAEPNWKAFLVFGFSAAGSVAYLLLQGQIPLLVGSRFEVSGYMTALIWMMVPSGVVLVTTWGEESTRIRAILRIGAVSTIAVAIFSLFGFRTPILIYGTWIVLALYYLRIISRRSLVLLLVALVIIAILFWNFRLQESTSDRSFNIYTELGFTPRGWLDKFAADLYWSFFRESVSVFSAILEEIPSSRDFYLGGATAASFISILPGSQLASRELVTQLVYGQPPKTSLTPSILGLPYMDFGLVGVIIVMGLIGVVLQILYIKMYSNYFRILDTLIYTYFLTIIILSIHSGLSDPITLVFLPVVLAFVLMQARSNV